MKWALVCLAFSIGCVGGGSSAGGGCPDSPQLGGECTDGKTCVYPGANGARDTTCACTVTGWRCSTCGNEYGDCTPGDSCYFSDWERDCDCGCTAHGHWSCTGLYQNYSCPTDSTYQDAGIDAM